MRTRHRRRLNLLSLLLRAFLRAKRNVWHTRRWSKLSRRRWAHVKRVWISRLIAASRLHYVVDTCVGWATWRGSWERVGAAHGWASERRHVGAVGVFVLWVVYVGDCRDGTLRGHAGERGSGGCVDCFILIHVAKWRLGRGARASGGEKTSVVDFETLT